MALLGEIHLYEVGGHHDLLEISGWLVPPHRCQPEPFISVFAAGHEVSGDDPLGGQRNRKRGKSPSDVTANVAELQAANHDGVESGAGDNPKMTRLRYGPSQPPVRNGNPHATLDQHRRFAVHTAHDRRAAVVS
jgi:hypothetical protein